MELPFENDPAIEALLEKWQKRNEDLLKGENLAQYRNIFEPWYKKGNVMLGVKLNTKLNPKDKEEASKLLEKISPWWSFEK
jgi:hypothetical protein